MIVRNAWNNFRLNQCQWDTESNRQTGAKKSKDKRTEGQFKLSEGYEPTVILYEIRVEY